MSAIIVSVRVTPRGGRDVVEGVNADGELRVRVSVAPADGAANKAVCKLVAKTLGLPRGAVTLVSGTTSRHKRLRIEGVAASEVEARWPGASVRTD